VRDEGDRLRIDSMLGEEPFESGDDPSRDAVGVIVRRRNLDGSDERTRRRVDGDDVGERPADVDPDPKGGDRYAPSAPTSPARTIVASASATRPPCA
jgi:hypothetical protein